jgi:ABC-type dipeptide/oligopeptide/nickel transport system permease subunit
MTDPVELAGNPALTVPGQTDAAVLAGTHVEALAGNVVLDVAAPSGVSLKRDAWRRFRRNRLAMVGLVVIGLLVLVAVLAPLVARQDPYAISTQLRKPPSGDHWFGTDSIGRDLFARIVFGARVSLLVGLSTSLLATVIGVTVGAIAGFVGGWVDALLMRVTDVLLAFPYIILAISIIVIIGRGLPAVILVLGLLGWLGMCRVLRASFLQLKEMEFIEAARAVGVSNTRIILRHLLPNAIQPVIVYATLFAGSAVLSEAALSFLNVGVVDPTPSWGLMVNQGRKFLTSAPHLLLFPGGAIFIMVLSFLFVGDGLRDALDPKLR